MITVEVIHTIGKALAVVEDAEAGLAIIEELIRLRDIEKAKIKEAVIEQDIKATADHYTVFIDTGRYYDHADFVVWKTFRVGEEATMAQQILAEVTARWPDEKTRTRWLGDIVLAVYTSDKRSEVGRVTVDVRNADRRANIAWLTYVNG